VIARSDAAPVAQGLRGVELELVGDDRVGIVSNLTRILSESGVSIEHIHTEIVGTTPNGPRTFKVMAHLLVPNALGSDELRRRLEAVASEMMVDIALGDRRA
jgi:glycine cleavage system regulatory protein